MINVKYLIIPVAIVGSFVLFYATQLYSIKRIDLSLKQYEANYEEIRFNVEKIDNLSDHFYIKGWIVNTNKAKTPEKIIINVLLENQGRFYSISTKIQKRLDIMRQLNLSKRKRNAGFSASVIKKIMQNGEYQVYVELVYGETNYLIKANETVIF